MFASNPKNGIASSPSMYESLPDCPNLCHTTYRRRLLLKCLSFSSVDEVFISIFNTANFVLNSFACTRINAVSFFDSTTNTTDTAVTHTKGSQLRWLRHPYCSCGRKCRT